MKVLVITNSFKEPACWMASIYNISMALARQGHQVEVLTTKTKGSSSQQWMSGVMVERVPCMFIPDPWNMSIPLFFGAKVFKKLRTFQPDVVLISKYYFWTSLSVFLTKFLGYKTMFLLDTFPGISWFAPSNLLNFCTSIYSRTLGKVMLRLADKVVLLGHHLDEGSKKLGLKRIQHVNTTIDISKSIPCVNKNSVAREGVRTVPTYCSVARLDAVKGYHHFINFCKLTHDTYKLLGKSVPKMTLVCGGKYPERRQMLQERFPFIEFKGYVEDIIGFFKTQDVMFLTSKDEGTPAVILEARSAGCHVVVLNEDIGAVKELMVNPLKDYSYEEVGRKWLRILNE